MRVGNYSVMIPEGCERDSGHVELPHGATYQIRLMNHCHSRRCDAEVTVDGKSVGFFRVDQNGSIILERPLDDHGKFTFFKVDSQEGEQAGAAGISKDDRGLIQVVFKPEKARPKSIIDAAVPTTGQMRLRSVRRGPGGQSCGGSYGNVETYGGQAMNFAPASAGLTGLTGHSNQTFHHVANLDYDPDGAVTISIRLVCGTGVRPLVAVAKGNPIPSAVE